MDNYDLLFTNSPSNSETAIKLKHVRKLANCKCVVCGDKPTGYHYSVLSCNGCKTFFRRTIISNRVFLCRRGGGCKIGTDFRCMCRACRFDKCIQVGMNREMIQYPIASECGVDMKMPLTRLVFDHTRSPTIEELIVVLLGRESSTYHCRRKDLPVEPDFPLKEVIKRPSILDEQASLFPLSHLPWFLVDTVLVVEYAKTFRMFQKLSEAEQCALLSSTGIHVLLFSQSFYSQKQNSRWLVFPDGHCVGVLSRFIKSHQRIEELYARPVECVRELQLSNREFAMLKAILLVTPEIARNRETHELISEVRRRLTFGLHKLIMHEFGDKGPARFGALLSAAASFIRFAEDRREAVQVAYTLNWLQLPPLVRDIYIKYEQDEQPIPIPNNT